MEKFFPNPSTSLSPSRAEKFQPPPSLLFRFLQTSASSRRRSGSRGGGRSLSSSPLFSALAVLARKKKSDIETQEPSSPTVTCIGQVRARRPSFSSSSSKRPKPPAPAPESASSDGTTTGGGCRCLFWILFCRRLYRSPGKRRKSCFRPFFRHRWFESRHCRKVPDVAEPCSFRDSDGRREQKNASEGAAEQLGGGSWPPHIRGNNEEKDTPIPPPRNALLLMRCRSAPHRAGEGQGAAVLSVYPPPPPPAGRTDTAEVEEKGRLSRPLILTRCKSEPASRTGGKITLADLRRSQIFS